ncbi:MAG: PEGA domain-containing protein [Deltaproteobacteria bacterium]|nr:PEGA domain-containing protein [Deltaproteobacteria bacterium]
MRRYLLIGAVLSWPLALNAEDPKDPPAEAERPREEKPAPASRPAQDPFARLRVVTPRGKLGPLWSVRPRDVREQRDRSKKEQIKVTINTIPPGALVFHGGKLLGKTPLTLPAHRNSTPLDITLQHGKRFMLLRTRIHRRVTRSYVFKLSPAKIH